MGGENGQLNLLSLIVTGSSPRGRGKRRWPYDASRALGLIPAWAGKTLSDLRVYRADRSDLGNP